MRRLHLALFAVLIATCSVAAHGAATASLSGVVRDSSGIAQIGAQVELLRSDLSVAASVYTNENGRFIIPTVPFGRYAVKAMGASFLPSLRENLHIRSNTIVNLTLNTLFEVMQWLPSEPRASNTQKDDWAWTLRSASNRPLLRWLEDGPLVVASNGSGRHPRLKARLLASGQEGSFGESGERITATVEDIPSDSRELLARVDFAPGSTGNLESMLGFRQDLGFVGSVQSVAAVAFNPGIKAAGTEGLVEAAVRTWETMNLGDEFEAEVGSSQVLASLTSHSTNTVVAALPFATVGWREGNSAFRYSMATMVPGSYHAPGSGLAQESGAEDSDARIWLPVFSARNGDLLLEHGLHQQLGWERRTERSSFAVLVYADHIDNPVIEAMSHFAPGNSPSTATLFDSATNLMRAAGPDFSTIGMQATFDHPLPGGIHLRLGYANGDALALSAKPHPVSLVQVLAGAHARRAQMCALTLSGTLEGTGTHWRASYRWQPAENVTGVAPFAEDAAEPFLNLHLRQHIHSRRGGTGGIDAIFNVRNLLAQGYRPYFLSDGSLLIFAQDQRGISAGLGFTF
jgi:hypothetical protein